MKIVEIITGLQHEVAATKALCRSRKSNSELGASQLASCKSQGFRSREGEKSFKIGRKRVKVKNKTIRGKKYGGPLPAYGD
jgi:hypothetical protein